MCGRFVRSSSLHEIAKEFGIEAPSFDLAPNYNISPSQEIAIVANKDRKQLLKCKWGFIPSWSKDPKTGYNMINARAETVAEKPSYKGAFRNGRILIPANGFYEWKNEGKTKTPYYIQLKSKRPFGFAGLLSIWTDTEGQPVCTCTIITTEANSALQGIHDRMPVILRSDDQNSWLDSSNMDKEKLTALLKPFDPEEMDYYAVSKIVNTASHNSVECITPV